MTTLAPPEAGLRLVNQPVRFWRGSRGDLREVWRHRELLRALVARNLRGRYKGAMFGWAWALVRPLVMLLVYGVAVGVFLGAGRAVPQFMIFIFCGLLGWTLFAAIVNGCITEVVGNGALLARANFPRLLLPLSVVVASMVDFCLQACVLVVGYVLVSDVPQAGDLLWLAPALWVLVLFGLAIGLVLSAANVYYRDVGFLTDVALQVGFWATPVLYSFGQVRSGAAEFGLDVDLVTQLYLLNPMASVVIGFQRALWPAASSDAAAQLAFGGQLGLRLAILSVLVLVLVWLAMRVFVRLAGNFGQEI